MCMKKCKRLGVENLFVLGLAGNIKPTESDHELSRTRELVLHAHSLPRLRPALMIPINYGMIGWDSVSHNLRQT